MQSAIDSGNRELNQKLYGILPSGVGEERRHLIIMAYGNTGSGKTTGMLTPHKLLM